MRPPTSLLLLVSLMALMASSTAVAGPSLTIYYDASFTTQTPPTVIYAPFHAYVVVEDIDALPGAVPGVAGFEFTAVMPPEVSLISSVINGPSPVNFASLQNEYSVGMGGCVPANANGQALLMTFEMIYFQPPAPDTVPLAFEPLGHSSFSPPQPGMVDCYDNLYGLGGDSGTLSGTVSDEAGPLEGVTVDIVYTNGDMLTTFTDASGLYSFENLATGPVTVSIVVPLGHLALSPADGSASIGVAPGDVTVQNFELTTTAPVDRPRVIGYWKHQVNVHLRGKGHADETYEAMTSTYPNDIFLHFFMNGLSPVHVEGVSHRVDQGLPAAPDLTTMAATLNAGGSHDTDSAKRQYLLFLLNFASGRISNTSVISEDGLTASQAVAHVASLLSDADVENDREAELICFEINHERLLSSGMVPDSTPLVMYRNSMVLERVSANPSRSGSAFRFISPEGGRITATVFDLRGRLVRRVMDSVVSPGAHMIRWDGRGADGSEVAGGVYFVRITRKGHAVTSKVTIVK